MTGPAAAPYDALLVLSFGGPEGPDDVRPFLDNVTRGRAVPAERLAAVAEHYLAFGGVSPINAANRALVADVRAELGRHGITLPVFWGNRNWHPFVTDAMREMAGAGVRRALVFCTSAYASYSSCRQYLEDLERARQEVGDSAPRVEKLRHYFDHPGFIAPQIDAVRAALDGRGAERRATTRLVFTAHSIPLTMATVSGRGGDTYVRQLLAASDLIARAAAPDLGWELAFQSRSGPGSVPWLEPDIGNRLRDLVVDGVRDVVVVPVGFVSDHVEVVWDLDHEAAGIAAELDLGFARTPTPGGDPRFVAMVRELLDERLDPSVEVRALSDLGPSGADCSTTCCLPDRPTVS
ncbi:MAG TPA: ferrochelatase [Mycobacteriales bacterium]|nr:ferrochelatase [Mycobacteriales bacterium]